MGQDFSRENLIAGPWDEDLAKYPEPELKDYFTHPLSGYRCLIRRNAHQWTYCGYVQLPADHPDYQKCYSQLEDDIKVHGGLTFSENGQFGFDCHHLFLGDLSPVDETLSAQDPDHFQKFDSLTSRPPHYWTYEEVKKETEWLAQQFWARAS